MQCCLDRYSLVVFASYFVVKILMFDFFLGGGEESRGEKNLEGVWNA